VFSTGHRGGVVQGRDTGESFDRLGSLFETGFRNQLFEINKSRYGYYHGEKDNFLNSGGGIIGKH
jgi:hypothetical protein